MKMSKEDSPGPTVCENFEPQAWRKTVCKNCFQPPEVHVAGSGENGVSNTSGTENKSGDNVVEKKAAAASLKNKFEQLEKDKYKPKDVSSNTLPRTKKASGLSLITEKYDQLDRQAGKLESPTKGIPPPTPPKTYKKDGSMKSKFGSMENVSAPDMVDSTSDNKLSAKFKFGSMENISNVSDKKKDSMVMTITQKKNIGSSMENISSVDKMMDSRQAMLSKLDSFQNEVKSGAMSAAGQTVIHKQKDGNVEIITLPKTPIDKPKDSKLIPKDSPMKVNEKTEPKAKFEKPELKSNNKENGLSKVGQSKFDLKSKSNEADNKQSELKSAKDLLSTNKLKSTKADDTNDKPTDKDAKDTKSGWKRPELKSANKEKEEIKPTSLKDRLSKPGDRLKTEEPSKAGLSLKDQLKSPTTEKDKDPLAKLKDKLKSPTTETDNKQAPSWKDRLKSSSSDSDKKTETKQSADLKLKTTTKIESDKVKSPLSNDKKEIADDKKISSNDTKKVTEVDKKSSVSVDKKVDTSLKDKEVVDKSPSSSKLDIKGKIGTSDKSSLENGAKSQDKTPPNDLKSKFNKPGLNSTKDDNTNSKAKPFDLRNNLKKKTDIPATDKDAGKSDTKAKIELPSLKSNKLTSLKDKSKETDSKVDDAKPSDKIGNKFEPKFKLNKTNEPKPSVVEEKSTGKAKFELPKLKSKSDPREETKSKFEPKSKINDIKTDTKNKFEIPSLKKTKSPEPKNDKDTPVKSNDSKDDSTKDKNTADTKILNGSKNDSAKDSKSSFKVGDKETKVDTKVSPTDTANTDKDKLDKSNEADKTTKNGATSKGTESVGGFQTNSETNKKESRIADTNKTKEVSTENNNTPVTSNISVTTSFENISSDSEVISGDACAAETKSTRDTKSPLHVDTQVFTSSRSKTAGVSSLNDSKFDDNSTTGFSALGINKSNNKSNKTPPKDTLLNGDIVLEHFNESSSKDEKMDNEKTIVSNYSDIELEKMKAELLNMTERCQNLETENEILRGDLNKKALHESSIKKQREEVESAINGLRGQLKSMEDKCSQLESENLNMMNDLKAKHEINHSKPHTKETDEIDEKLTAKEKFTEDLMEENDQLKQEINELKMEMEEMYDSFRDQEAEEFREIQKELEYTAKNCRILQFKLRKMERRNEQTEQDKNTFEERLRKLQNSFQDRDAVSHIHSLEDELRLAKEVSVRLHDELDLMEDRRGKVEEENRHLTELLEQADRKQFRLELEVDKLRDKVVELRQELRLREGGADPAENRKDSE